MSDSRPGDRSPERGDEPAVAFDDTAVEDPVVRSNTEQLPDPVGTNTQDRDRRRRVLRAAVIGLIGAVIGFGLAVLIVALTGDDDAGGDSTADLTSESLEADLRDRDARISELEAALAEARAASEGSDQDTDARNEALDERAAVLEEWSRDLSDREDDIARREAELDDRAGTGDEGDGSPADGGAGIIDDEVVDGIVQRVLDQLRALFS